MPVVLASTSIWSPCVVRGFCIATGPYSSFCVCAGVLVLGGSNHMEDDDQDREGDEMREVVETLEREEEINGWRDNERSHTWWHVDEHVFLWDTRFDTLSHAVHVNKDEMCANVRENTRCEGVLFTHTVGYSGSLSTVNETNCNKKRFEQKKNLWSHFQLHSDAYHHDEVESQYCHPVCWSMRALNK